MKKSGEVLASGWVLMAANEVDQHSSVTVYFGERTTGLKTTKVHIILDNEKQPGR